MSRRAILAAHYLDLLPRGSFRLRLLVRLSARLSERRKKSREGKPPIRYSGFSS